MPAGVAHQVGTLPPVASLFAAVLGVNPVQHVLAAHGALSSLSAAHQRVITGRQFFPELISGPFHNGLSVVLLVATALSMLAALASMMRGSHDPGSRETSRRDTGRHETGHGGSGGAAPAAGTGERAAAPEQIST